MIRQHLQPIPKRKTPWAVLRYNPKGIFIFQGQYTQLLFA